MKKMKYFLWFFVVLGIALAGCSEKLSPVDPIEESSMEKVFVSDFTAFMYPTSVTDPGEEKILQGMILVKNMTGTLNVESDNPFMNGSGTIIYNCNLDNVTGEGHYWGSVSLTLEADPGAVWDWTYNGKVAQTGEFEWTLSLKLVGKGTGGSVAGMHFLGENIVTYAEPFPSFWEGNASGTIRYK
jgi:hypothetical protein